jgi:hypothetical protein
MTLITFDLPGIPPSANKRLHHMARYKSNQEWMGWTVLALRDAINRDRVAELPWPRIHVEYIFHYPRVTLADVDNLIGSTKPILDACKGIVVPDDNSQYVHDVSASVDKRSGQPAGLTVIIRQCGC